MGHLEDPIHIHLAPTLGRLILEVVKNKGVEVSERIERTNPGGNIVVQADVSAEDEAERMVN
jgi:hypothetical protein